MRKFHAFGSVLSVCASVALLAACSQEPAEPTAEAAPEATVESAAVAVETAPVTETEAVVATAPESVAVDEIDQITVADLEAVELGLTRENELLEAVVGKLEAAATEQEKEEIALGVTPEQIEAEAAASAGVDVALYRQTKDELDRLLNAADTAGLSEEVAGDLVVRQPRLAQLRTQNQGLVSKVSGS